MTTVTQARDGPAVNAPGPTNRLAALYDRLLDAFGPQGWWPAQTPFEVMVGAVLTQNTNWSNVEKALKALKGAGLMAPEAIHALSDDDLAGYIRPAGYYNLKARRLKNLVALVMAAGGGDPPRLLERPTPRLRRDLLAVGGVGPETADSILLYAAGRPVFVIDAYTRRMAERHALADPGLDYHALQALFVANLPRRAQMFNEFHALIVRLGKEFCRPRPICTGCPLENF